jgi:hypothetical protein
MINQEVEFAMKNYFQLVLSKLYNAKVKQIVQII